MIIKDLQALINKAKGKKTKDKSAKMVVLAMGFAVATGVAVGIVATKWGKKIKNILYKNDESMAKTVEDEVDNKAKTISDVAAKAEQDICTAIDDIDEKTENIKDTYHEITHDIHKTAENVSK